MKYDETKMEFENIRREADKGGDLSYLAMLKEKVNHLSSDWSGDNCPFSDMEKANLIDEKHRLLGVLEKRLNPPAHNRCAKA